MVTASEAVKQICHRIIRSGKSPEDFFAGFDQNNDGALTLAEFTNALGQLGYKNLRSDFVIKCYDAFDVNHDNSVSKQEFIETIRNGGELAPLAGTESKLTIHQSSAKLFINVVEARNISDTYPNLKPCDPYVIVRFGQYKRKCKRERDTLNPQWNFQVEFPISEDISRDANMTSRIKVELWDWDRGSRDDPIGSVTIPLKLTEIPPMVPIDMWKDVVLHDSPKVDPQKKPRIHLQMTYHDPSKVKRYAKYAGLGIFGVLAFVVALIALIAFAAKSLN